MIQEARQGQVRRWMPLPELRLREPFGLHHHCRTLRVEYSSIKVSSEPSGSGSILIRLVLRRLIPSSAEQGRLP